MMTDRVLIADDDSGCRNLICELLEMEGMDVVTASDGRQAVVEFDRLHPDIVLLDVQMPGMDGFTACRHIKKNPATRLVPVIFMTGLSEIDDRVRGIEAGADDFLIKPISPPELVARVRSLLSLKHFTDDLERAETVLLTLARSIEEKDAYTQGHCERLSRMSVLLGEKIGLSVEQISALRRGGIVHDIGKVAVPDSILLKPARLTPDEVKIMQEHSVAGERICAPLRSFRLVLPIIRHHHEKMDGTGYPDGLKGEQIPITARVLQIVDVYDALTTRRPYKRALTPAEAMDVMAEEVRRGWWDPEIFERFKQLSPETSSISDLETQDHLKGKQVMHEH